MRRSLFAFQDAITMLIGGETLVIDQSVVPMGFFLSMEAKDRGPTR